GMKAPMHPAVEEVSARPTTSGDVADNGHVRSRLVSSGLDSDWEAVERLTPIVFGDERVRDRLLAAGDHAEFGAEVAAVAAANGRDLRAERIGALLSDARRRWLERWL